ncbi:MAG: riboflavin synthase [Alphaproteobacteria bacterium]|nr:riboflavin synthase [Alphaproteobacteria bacterium]
MFTGIITDIGTVKSVDKEAGDVRLGIETAYDLSSVDMGASIACSGCCLTVVEKKDNVFFVDVSAESISKTTIGDWDEGSRVNLERALKVGDELGGHIVSGHVDGLAKLIRVMPDGDSYRLKFEVPQDLACFIAPKGSVSLDGISLTVNEVEGNQFGVNIIPHTWEQTTLSDRSEGDDIHLEIDMLARYMARMLEVRA